MTKTGSLPCTVGDGYDGTAGTYGADTDVSGKKVSPDRRKTGGRSVYRKRRLIRHFLEAGAVSGLKICLSPWNSLYH